MTDGEVFSFKFRFASNLLSPLGQRCRQLSRGASRKGFTLKANYALYIMNCKLDKILRHFVSLNDELFSLYIAVKFLYLLSPLSHALCATSAVDYELFLLSGIIFSRYIYIIYILFVFLLSMSTFILFLLFCHINEIYIIFSLKRSPFILSLFQLILSA